MSLLAGITQTGMLLAGIALLIFLLMRRSFRYYGWGRRKTKADQPYLVQSTRPVHESRTLSTAPPDVLRWHVEMHETARELKAELDSKMRLLQLLIGQAREEAERLERLLGSRDDSATGNSADSVSPVGAGTTSSKSATHEREICALASEGQTAREIAQRVGISLDEVERVLSLRTTSGGGT